MGLMYLLVLISETRQIEQEELFPCCKFDETGLKEASLGKRSMKPTSEHYTEVYDTIGQDFTAIIILSIISTMLSRTILGAGPHLRHASSGIPINTHLSIFSNSLSHSVIQIQLTCVCD